MVMSNNTNRKMVVNVLQRKSRTARNLSTITKIELTSIHQIVNNLKIEGIVTFKLEKGLHGHLIKNYSLINTLHSHGT